MYRHPFIKKLPQCQRSELLEWDRSIRNKWNDEYTRRISHRIHCKVKHRDVSRNNSPIQFEIVLTTFLPTLPILGWQTTVIQPFLCPEDVWFFCVDYKRGKKHREQMVTLPRKERELWTCRLCKNSNDVRAAPDNRAGDTTTRISGLQAVVISALK